MKAVIDASAAFVMLATPERIAPLLDHAGDILAPELIVPELLNGCWKLERSGAVAPSLDTVLGLLERIRLIASLPHAAAAAALAQRLDHPVYDCLYAAIAQRERATFITADKRFAGKLTIGDIEVALL